MGDPTSTTWSGLAATTSIPMNPSPLWCVGIWGTDGLPNPGGFDLAGGNGSSVGLGDGLAVIRTGSSFARTRGHVIPINAHKTMTENTKRSIPGRASLTGSDVTHSQNT